MSAGLVLDDGLFYSRGFGFSSKTASETLRPNEYTVFRWGSLSKVMTATALLSLVDDPQAQHIQPAMTIRDLADDDRYVPELRFVCKTFNVECQRGTQRQAVTLGQLASHHSGLADVLSQSTFADEPPGWDTAKPPFLGAKCGKGSCDAFGWMNQLKTSWLRFPPGDLYAYSGGGMELAGLVEQRVSGKPFAQFVKDHLFAPLGMRESTMDPTSLSEGGQAQIWQLKVGPNGGFSFTATTPEAALSPGDQEPMLWPAGGLASSVRDMSRFIAMWLSGRPPTLNGRALLSSTSIRAAETPVGTRLTTPNISCGKTNDTNNNVYQACSVPGPGTGPAIGWFVETTEPQIAHNGSLGVSSSQTVLRLGPTKMGATAVASTDGGQTLPGDSQDFLDVVVRELLLQAGVDADKANTSWENRPLSIAVARVLFLSGKAPTTTDLTAFTPQFIVEHKLSTLNVVSFLANWQRGIGKCQTFRIRDARDGTHITARFQCEKSEWEATLTVEAGGLHRVSWFEITSPQANGVCKAGCTTENDRCIQQAHSGVERGACVHVMEICKAQCSQ